MLQLRPSSHALEDNNWHTLLITVLGTLFVWLGWDQLLDVYRSGQAITGVETRLLAGKGHALYVWIESLTDPLTPWLWNRVLSGLGWFCTLFMVVRILTRLSGFLTSIPALILLITFPGLSMMMGAGGSGSWGAFFFLMAFSTLLLEEDAGALLRGGVYAALAVGLNPLFFLPTLGLLAGTFEGNRVRLLRIAIGYIAGLLVIALLLLVLAPDGLSTWLPGPAAGDAWAGQVIPTIAARHFFLIGGLIILLVYGARRRGLSWWCLVLCLPALALQPFLTAGPSEVVFPLFLIFSLAFSKLPGLLGIAHPRAYQSVILCQLLLWLPVQLDLSSAAIFRPVSENQVLEQKK